MSDQDSAAERTGHPLDRRTLLKDASLLASGAVAATVFGSGLASASSQRAVIPLIRLQQTDATPVASPSAGQVDLDTYAPTNFSDSEFATLKAALDRIIPADDLGPGANEMGVFVYIDWALSGRVAATLPTYQQGLAALDAAAGSDGFSSLDTDQQDSILTDAEGGKLADAPAGFFATLVQHTREGAFSDPIHGGNKDFAGWDLMGYPGVKLIWTPEDQAVNSTPTPEHISVEKYGGTKS